MFICGSWKKPKSLEDIFKIFKDRPRSKEIRNYPHVEGPNELFILFIPQAQNVGS